jgi:hypothetical protein
MQIKRSRLPAEMAPRTGPNSSSFTVLIQITCMSSLIPSRRSKLIVELTFHVDALQI